METVGDIEDLYESAPARVTDKENDNNLGKQFASVCC